MRALLLALALAIAAPASAQIFGSSGGGCTSMTAVTASGTAVDFTGIPTTAKMITVTMAGVSSSGTATDVYVQLGTSGGIENTGYTSQSVNTIGGTSSAYTAAFGVRTGSAATALHGQMAITLLNSSANLWAEQAQFADSGVPNNIKISAGSKATSATLDRVRVTFANGTDTFDAGSIGVTYCQ